MGMVKHKVGEDYHGLQKFKFENFRLTILRCIRHHKNQLFPPLTIYE